MAERSWFIAEGGQQQGPFPESQFREFIASGRVTPDTLVWTDGMTAWQRAADIPGLMGSAHAPPPMPLPGGPQWSTTSNAGGPAAATFGVWALFGRTLLVILGIIFVIPAPWVMTSFYRWFIEHARAPRVPNLGFAGKPGDIWWVFILTALLSYAGVPEGAAHPHERVHYLPLILIPIQAALGWLVLRWIITNVTSDGRSLGARFRGDVWPYIGWSLLLYISIITIIGWAWVTTAWMRWICRNIEGAPGIVSFTATGWQVLWRTLAFVFGCIFIIPIPWLIHWLARWYVSQFSIGDRAA